MNNTFFKNKGPFKIDKLLKLSGLENINNYTQDVLTSEAIRFIFPFVRAIIAQITQNGGILPVLLENVSFNLIKS